MPQIAADYRISTYFRDPAGVYVNLYIPSTLQWNQDGARFALKQTTAYPLDSLVHFEVQAAQPRNFALRFRIPAWAGAPRLLVNGKRTSAQVIPGTFVSILREWKNGDRLELELPMKLRLEPIDKRHPDTAALLSGPVVLFGIEGASHPTTRGQLLAANPVGPGTWLAQTATGPMYLRTFYAIADEPYRTYFQLTA